MTLQTGLIIFFTSPGRLQKVQNYNKNQNYDNNPVRPVIPRKKIVEIIIDYTTHKLL